VLVPQDGKCPGRAAQVRPPGGEEGAGGDLEAEDKQHALAAARAFEGAYGAKFPKAVAKITDDADQLLAFYDYPCLRHEAPCNRVEVKDLHRHAVAAA
jgi:hypothetical protein